MRSGRTRGFLANSPAIAISILALVFALGSGAGYAASTVGGTTKPVWHNLKLARHWSGGLKYTIINDVVYLSGWAGSSSNNPGIMTTLPRAARPAAARNR